MCASFLSSIYVCFSALALCTDWKVGHVNIDLTKDSEGWAGCASSLLGEGVGKKEGELEDRERDDMCLL